jgi:hypothetical protein
MTTEDVLKAARAKITDPNKWTRGVNARDSSGLECFAHKPEAVCWCAQGAVLSIDSSYGSQQISFIFLKKAALLLGYVDWTDLNDKADHETVLKMFDMAIGEA